MVLDLGPYRRKEAMERAGRLLAMRFRTRIEMIERLADSGFDAEVVASTVERLEELGLVDDAAFAKEWIEGRAKTKARPPRVLLDELLAKGVEPEMARAALEEVGPDEVAQATDVAAQVLRRYAGDSLKLQGARLMGALLRRGFSEEAAGAAVRAVLPPEGWD